jgi:hypothetical protein
LARPSVTVMAGSSANRRRRGLSMAADWDVEAALDEMVEAMASGSVVLEMDELTREMVKKIYRPGFEARTEEEWKTHRSTILELASKAGRGAELATILLWVHGVVLESAFLDRETVCLVSVTVSHLDCGIALERRGDGCALKGVFCPKVACPGVAGAKLDEILRKLEASG